MNDSTKEVTTLDSKEKAEILLRVALGKKALNPTLLKLSGLASFTDYFLVLSARSGRQVKAIAEAIMEQGKKLKLNRISAEGVNQGAWALLDYGDVVIHVFHTPVREFYDLEGLWVEAPREKFPKDILAEIETAAQYEEGYEDDVEPFD
jgi:ribosome-associated protein